MKQIIFYLGFVIVFIGCGSSSKKVENCNSYDIPVKISGIGHIFRTCSGGTYKTSNKNNRVEYYKGLYDKKNKVWYLDSKYIDIHLFKQDTALVKIKKNEPYNLFNLKTKQFTPTEITDIRKVWSNGNSNLSYNSYVFIKNNDPSKLVLVNPQDGTIGPTIDNVDLILASKQVPNNYYPYVNSPDGGIAISRIHEDGQRYFHFYGDEGNELRSPINLNEVVLEEVLGTKTIIQVVDPDLEIYWPIFFGSNIYLDKPDHLIGFLRPIKHLKEGNAQKWFYPTSFYPFIAVYDNSKLLKYFSTSPSKNIEKRFDFLNAPSEKPGLLDYQQFWGNAPGSDGKIYQRSETFLIFQDRVELVLAKKTFKTRELAVEFLKEDKKNVLAEAAINKANYQERQRQLAISNQRRYQFQQEENQRYIENFHKFGPNTSSIYTYDYDVAIYCRAGGPRCSSYQKAARDYQKSQNRQNAIANQQRINNLYRTDNSSGQKSTRQASQSSLDYDNSVKRANEKERVRARDEQWKKRSQDLSK